MNDSIPATADIRHDADYPIVPDCNEPVRLGLSRLQDCSFFSTSTYYHPEQNFTAKGFASEPLPYTMQRDNGVMCILLACFFMMAVVYSHRRLTIRQRIQVFLLGHTRRNATSDLRTGSEIRHTVYLFIQAAVLFAFFTFHQTQATTDLSLPLTPIPALFGIYCAICGVYVWLKLQGYRFVNWIFFDKEARRSWIKSYTFLFSAESVALFPIALTTVTFNLSVSTTSWLLAVTLTVIKLMLLYKTFYIFFAENRGVLQLILYLCALETVPALLLRQALMQTNEILLGK